MTRFVYCTKLNKEAEGFEQPPYPGPLGRRILESISTEAWALWIQHQTMLINEYRLNMLDPKSRAFLAQEMEKFLFESGSDKPSGYIPPETSSFS